MLIVLASLFKLKLEDFEKISSTILGKVKKVKAQAKEKFS